MSGGDIPFTRRVEAPGELDNIRACLESGLVSGDGPFSSAASAALESLVGAPVLLTTSCTHALELAALVSDIGPDDEVVLPSFTFSSTANAFALRDAHLRFADIDPETLSMELPQLEEAITERTTVVCAVPYGGVTRDIAAIAELCEKRSINLIEDAAQALFATSAGRALGTFGRLGALSFHATKNISCGEGGALILGDRSLVPRAQIIREKGTDRGRFLRGEIDRYTWQELGSSYLPADVLAAMLVAQLEHAETIQAHRHAAWTLYHEALAPLCNERGIRLQVIPEGLSHPAHLFCMVLPPSIDRDRVISELRACGIGAASHFEPLHLAPAARNRPSLPETEGAAAGLLRLPLFNDITGEEAGRVAEAFTAIIAKSGP